MAFAIGTTGVYRTTVTAADSAHTLGNPGVHVLATPKLAEFCDLAAAEACRDAFRAGQGSRRLRVDIRHLAATAVGDDIEIRAELVEVAGDQLVLTVSGRDSRGDIVAGKVVRRRT